MRFVQLKNRWLKDGVSVNDPASPAEIERFEREHGVALPRSFTVYLSVMNGMQDGATDREMISFFSLAAIDRQDHLPAATKGEVNVVFADYCIACHRYLLRVSISTDATPVFVSDRESEQPLAASFDEYIDQYLQTPSQVVHGWA